MMTKFVALTVLMAALVHSIKFTGSFAICKYGDPESGWDQINCGSDPSRANLGEVIKITNGAGTWTVVGGMYPPTVTCKYQDRDNCHAVRHDEDGEVISIVQLSVVDGGRTVVGMESSVALSGLVKGNTYFINGTSL
jgi:hypothetical protein